ncbi:heterogeneous nuclear ribonucleoprotein L-like [Ochlerotatus camptorhynchus]|uniref:heterogeneous nuclear ribonucleoprotein L-like n=1 Tax=Ochlerotatus camptorhynchus TaxID=644619 RepID=UPI0031DCA96A
METNTGTHVELMKEAPLNRNGPANFIQPAQQQGAVMMVNGLDNNTVITDKLYNLFCLYENIVRIKFLKTKEHPALEQHSNSDCIFQAELLVRVDQPLRSAGQFDQLQGLQRLQEQSLPYPSKVLHFFNTPPGMSEDLLLTAFTTKDCHPSQVRMFPLKSERSSSGLVEFPSVALAVNVIMKSNHSAIDHKRTKFPFIMKLCFSSSKTINGAWSNESTENMGMALALGNPMSAAAATVSAVAAASGGVTPISVTGDYLKSKYDDQYAEKVQCYFKD